jgi:TonB family protein
MWYAGAVARRESYVSMALTRIPLLDPAPAPPERPDEAVQSSLPFDRDGQADRPVEAPVLLIHLQDDLARSRLREAFWISLVAHLLLVIALALGPKYLPMHRMVAVRTAEDLLRQRDATFLALPPDEQQVTARPKSNIISDKDRIAASRAPQLDRKTLQELRDARPPGPPGPGGAPQSSSAPTMAQAPPDSSNALRAPAAQHPPPTHEQEAKLRTPPMDPKQAFGSAMSPGSVIEQAARGAAASRGGYGGAAGDYGTGFTTGGGIKSNMDILSDTMGVDFGPYLARVLHDVRQNWYGLIPEVARAPLMKKGNVSIEFAIMKDGSVAGMRLVSPSGDISLDRAAWGGISGSNPFPPLPNQFRGQYLALRFRFFYNPDKHELQ